MIRYIIFVMSVCFMQLNHAADLKDHLISLGEGVNDVTFKFKGILNEKVTATEITSESKGKYAKAVFNIIDTNLNKNRANIVELWRSSDKAGISKSLSNKKNFDSNRIFFKNILNTKLIAVISYQDHFLVYVDHKLQGIDSYIKVYPLVESRNGLLLSNGMSDDHFYSVIGGEIISTYWKGL
ncbi:hypothetical protein AADZ84_17025 [Colwelliaceae bacterium MEBiC 14330]